MITVEGPSKVLYNLEGDPDEMMPYQDDARIYEFAQVIEKYLEQSATYRFGSSKRKLLIKDEIIQPRLRDLGYLE